MSDHHSADLYAAAAQKTQSVIAGVKADQFNDSTPCSDWNVQALVDNLVGGTGFFAPTLTGGSSDAPTGDNPRPLTPPRSPRPSRSGRPWVCRRK